MDKQKSSLPGPHRRIVELMQKVNVGRIEDLVMRDGHGQARQTIAQAWNVTKVAEAQHRLRELGARIWFDNLLREAPPCE